MNKTLFQKNLLGRRLFTVLLVVALLSQSVLAIDSYDIGTSSSTSSFKLNSVLTFNTNGTLNVNGSLDGGSSDDYTGYRLVATNDKAGTIATNGNAFSVTDTVLISNSTIQTTGSGKVTLGELLNGTGYVYHHATGGLSLSGELENLYVEHSDTVTLTGNLDINGLLITGNNKNVTLDLNSSTTNWNMINATYVEIGRDNTLTISNNGDFYLGFVIDGSSGSIIFNGHGKRMLSGYCKNITVNDSSTVSTTNNLGCYNLNITANTTLDNNGHDIYCYKTNIAADTILTTKDSGTTNLGILELSGTLMNSNTIVIDKVKPGEGGNAKLDGSGTATVSNQLVVNNDFKITGTGAYTFNSGTSINSSRTLTINGSGAHSLGAVTLAGTLTNNDANLNQLSSLTIATGSIGIISGTTATSVATANIAGTLNQNSENTLTLETLNIASGDIATLNVNIGTLTSTGINNSGTLNATVVSDSTLDLGADADINTLTLAGTLNSSSAQTIATLNVADGDTGIVTGSGAVSVTTANISGTLEQKSTGLLTLTDLNVNSGTAKLIGTGTTTVTNQLALANNLEISGTGVKTFSGGVSINSGKTLTIDGSAVHDLGTVELAGTLNNEDANLSTLSSLTIASGNTGTLSGTAATAVISANINGTHNYTATAETTYNTTNIAGTLNQNSVKTLTLTNLNIAGGNTANLNVNAGILAVNNIINNGTMNFNIAKAGKLVNNNSSALDLSANNSTLTLDFGDEADTSVYAATSGNIMSAGTATDDIDTVTSVYAINGVDGTTYTSVFTSLSDDTNNFDDGDLLNTNDRLRTYKLTDTGTGVIVSTNTAGISTEITSNGGSAQTAGALIKMIKNQGSMNAADKAYISALTQLQGVALTRGTQQTEGQEATTGTAQSALQGISGSTGAVTNQLTLFRSGGVAAGMTSFGSGGATSALDDMVDADTLSEAYDIGFTSASNTEIYKKVQIWANGYGSFGEQGTVNEMTGYDFHNIGTMIGLDYAFAEELRIGSLLGYSYNKTTSYEYFGTSEDNAIRLGAYSSYNWDNFFIDISPSLGIHMIDSNRNIWNGTTANGKRTGIDFNASGTVGYTFNLPDKFQITPLYSLAYTMFNDPEFSETGAGSANIDYDSFTSNSLIQDLGVRAGKLFKASDTLSLLPEVWTGWEIEYLNTGGTRNTVNVGQNFQTNMNSMATHRGYWGAGLTALLNDDISVYGRYDHKVWSKSYTVGFNVGIKISF